MERNTIAATKHFERDGFAIVPDVIDVGAISTLLAAIEAADGNGAVRRRGGQSYAMRNLLKAVPAIKSLAQSAPIRALVESVLGSGAIAVKGLMFDKTPAANWHVTWHQDLMIAVRDRRQVPGYDPWSIKAGVQHVQPPASVLERMVTLRLHLDDCGQTNGPLQVLPGSHRFGKLEDGKITEICRRTPAVSCVARPGDALLMRPLLLHASAPAREPGHRRVIHLEFAAGELDGGLEWNC